MAQNPAPGAAWVTGGAGAGAWVSVSVGGMGLAFQGTAISLGLTPLTAAGAVTGAAGYGLFRAIAEGDASALTAAALGGMAGAKVSVAIGGMGLAFKGTAISLGLAPVTAAGAVVGLAIYGLVKILDDSGSRETPDQTFERMEDKILWQEAYQQALLELNVSPLEKTLLGDAVEQKFREWEIATELNILGQQIAPSHPPLQTWQQEWAALKAERVASVGQSLQFTEFQLTEFTNMSGTIVFELLPSASDTTTPSTAATSVNSEAPSAPPPPASETGALAPQPRLTWQCQQLLKGHATPITALTISPDGQLLASGSWDGTVKLWNSATGAWNFTFLGQTQEVGGLAISRDRQLLVSGGFDRKITAWKLPTRTLLRTFFHLGKPYSHDGFVHAVLFTPDGQQVISAGDDHLIRIWDVHSGRLIRNLNGHTEAVLAIALSPDGQTLVSGGGDRTVRVWRLSDGKLLHRLTGHPQAVFAVAVSAKGAAIASGSSDGSLKLWNLATGTLQTTFTQAHAVLSVAFSPDGQTLASASKADIHLWSLPTAELSQTLNGSAPICFSPDGQLLISGSRDNSVKLWRRLPANSGICQVEAGETWWQILGVEATASVTEVKQAYRRLARIYHPDINTSPTAKAQMQRLNQAYRDCRQYRKWLESCPSASGQT